MVEFNKLLEVATLAGKILLESGAETYRVEDTICRICLSYGVKTADSFVTPTGIIVSISDGTKTLSLLKRITYMNLNLDKIHKINALSRQIQKKTLDLDILQEKLINIENEKSYNNKLVLIFAAIISGIFSYILGGDIYDLFCAAFIGFIIKCISNYFTKININNFFINYTCAAVASIIAIFFYIIHIPLHIDKTIIGAIMLLVPGLAITNAIRDTIAGDYLSGLTRGSEAILIALSIAAGTGTVIGFYVNTLGGSIL